jgi:hypothetical protein
MNRQDAKDAKEERGKREIEKLMLIKFGGS